MPGEKGITGIRMSEQMLQGKEQVILTRRICAVPGFQAAAGRSCQGFASVPKFLGCLRPRSDPGVDSWSGMLEGEGLVLWKEEKPGKWRGEIKESIPAWPGAAALGFQSNLWIIHPWEGWNLGAGALFPFLLLQLAVPKSILSSPPPEADRPKTLG